MSIRKISLQPLSLKGQIMNRALSCQHQKAPIKPVFQQKRTAMSIGHSRKPSVLNPRLPPIASIPVSASKKQITRKSISCKPSSQKINFDEQIMVKCRSKSILRPSAIQGLSREALEQRRENHLNTYFNIRKNNLKNITKENKQIYVRINSQKSLYSSRRLNTSSNSLTHSRTSNTSDNSTRSRKSISRVSRPVKPLVQSNKQEIKIVERKVDKMELNEMGNYLKIFCNDSRRNIKSLRQSKQNKSNKIELAPTLHNKQNNGSPLQQIIEEFSTKHRQRAVGRLPY